MANIGIYIGDISINGGGVTKFAINLARALKPYHKCIVISDYSREKKFHKGYEEIENIVLNENSEKEKIKKLSLVCKENNIDLIISNEIYLNRRCAAINTFCKTKIPYITVTHMRSELWFKETKNVILNTINKDIYEVCVCGWISEVKNYETAIRAIALIKDKINIRLNIIGGYSDKYKDYNIKLIELIKELNIEDNIKFWGTVENPYSIMQQMDVLLLTSKIEALPTVLIEGMAIGLPLISSNCKYGPSEILDEGIYGYLFNVYDYSELANNILDLLRNKKKYLYYKEKSIHRSDIFSFNSISEKYNKLIESLR